MNSDRAWHDAIPLGDGRVLVAGGTGDAPNVSAAVEIFDPASGNWQNALPMPNPRIGFKLAVLPNGNVLAIGGSFGSDVKKVSLYVPSANKWTSGGAIPGREYFSAITLNNGDVIVPGGHTWKTLKTTSRYTFTP